LFAISSIAIIASGLVIIPALVEQQQATHLFSKNSQVS